LLDKKYGAGERTNVSAKGVMEKGGVRAPPTWAEEERKRGWGGGEGR